MEATTSVESTDTATLPDAQERLSAASTSEVLAAPFRLKVVTWNVCMSEAPPMQDRVFQRLLGLEDASDVLNEDIVVIGLQEVNFASFNYLSESRYQSDPWSQQARLILAPRGYVQVTCSWSSNPRMLGILLLVFLRSDHLLSVDRVHAKFIRLGVFGFFGNKGVVAISLRYRCHINITFICSHFLPRPDLNEERVKHYAEVLKEVRVGKDKVSLLDAPGIVLVLGDLNFRVDRLESNDVAQRISNAVDSAFAELQHLDQLSRARTEGAAFQDFEEAPIRFPPTYKFNIGTNDYDLRRVPSWCDRILYRCNLLPPARCSNYSSQPSLCHSDHKPVTADLAFDLSHFSTSEPPRLVRFLTPSKDDRWIQDQNNLVQLRFTEGKDAVEYEWSSFDWVGLYTRGMASDQDCLTWMYLMSYWKTDEDSDGTREVINLLFKPASMPRKSIEESGPYRLGYYSRDRNCLLALSDEFEFQTSEVDRAEEAREDEV